MFRNLKNLVKFNWLVLIFIYLVIIAGSFVRITGSGMGCPDWPKCFGQWSPPSSASELPENYREIYSEKRAAKIEKFATFLSAIGLKKVAEEIKNDPNLRIELPYNKTQSWIEYINRLFGFLAGNGMLIAFVWLIVANRKRNLILLSALNLVVIAIQAWFGSIVVASNLVPWTITVHMLLALLVVALQLRLIYLLQYQSTLRPQLELVNSVRLQPKSYSLAKWMKLLIWISAIITTYQVFLGTQVREMIDELTIQGYTRSDWTNKLGIPFYIHRSFSWLVLVFICILAWKNEQTIKIAPLRWLFIILVLELTSGVLLVYVNMPGFVQIAHMLFATILFGIFCMLLFRINKSNKIHA